MFQKLLFLLLLGSTCHTLNAQQNKPIPSYKAVTGAGFIQLKNYYLLTLLQHDQAVRKLLEADSVLSLLTADKKTALTSSLKECTGQTACFIDRMKFTDEETKRVADRLAALYTPGNALGKLVADHLQPSGAYILYQQLPPQEMLIKAWQQDAAGINFALGIYAEGKKARYPNIDSASLPVQSRQFAGFAYSAAYLLLQEQPENKLFFTLPLTASLRFLEWNEREQAADYEPMTTGVNKAAYDRIKTVIWTTYPYSVILVPGAGPEEPSVALSAEGMLRCRLAAIQYRRGMAPFIMVSGGKVHPYKTPYCEAIEMKKFLMEVMNIPEKAIILEPHARHTTTNMRNCARLIFRYGLPFDKPGLVCTTRAQSLAITTTLPGRCQQELHETPYRNGARLSETESVFYPLIEALHINPEEPIDP